MVKLWCIPQFDPSKRFSAARDFVYGGVSYVTGQMVNKVKFPARHLKMLYEQRKIQFDKMRIVDGMTEDEISEYFKENKLRYYKGQSMEKTVSKLIEAGIDE